MNEVQKILSGGKLAHLIYKLPDVPLERALYEKVNYVLELFGGKWVRGKGHVFEEDPSDYLDIYLKTGELPPENPLAFFATPANVVDELLAEISTKLNSDYFTYLEPSTGKGNIIDGLTRHACSNITALKIDDYRYRLLLNKYPNLSVLKQNFLTWETDDLYDCIVMNPPFSVQNAKDVYIDHVLKAWSLLKPAGMLAAVLPVNWMFGSSKKLKEFREWVYQHGYYVNLKRGAFKQSSTMVNTCFIVVEKYSDYDYERLFATEHYVYLNRFVYELELTASNCQNFDTQRAKLWTLLDAGKNVDADIAKLYYQYVDKLRKMQTFMPMNDSWMDSLVEEFIEEWKTQKEYEKEKQSMERV